MTFQLSFDDVAPPRGLTRADVMTADEVADLLAVPVSTVREWGRNGTLPRIKVGRHVRFMRSKIERFLLGESDDGHAAPAGCSTQALLRATDG